MTKQSVSSILNEYPKAKESFAHFYVNKYSQPHMDIEEFYVDTFEAQIGYIMAWFRSEGITEYELRNLRLNQRDFNTAFLSLLRQYCETVK